MTLNQHYPCITRSRDAIVNKLTVSFQ